MKAWHVFAGDPQHGSLLVFAESPERARLEGLHARLWDFGDYIDTRARRAPEWDTYAIEQKVIETNEDLPEGAPPFYSDEEPACPNLQRLRYRAE